jgi:hypothetical protein
VEESWIRVGSVEVRSVSPLISGPASGVFQDKPDVGPPPSSKPAFTPKPVKRKVASTEYDLCSYYVKPFSKLVS